MKRYIPLRAALAALFLIACDGGDGASGACETTADCPAASACVSANGQRGCTPTCSVTADDCGGNATCTGVGASTIDVCQPPRDPNQPPDPADEPTITCATDAECQALAGGAPDAVCGLWRGTRSCTRRCAAEPDCDLPATAGVALDYLTCGDDEGTAGRTVCVPDPRCFMDPLSCTSVPGQR